MPLNSANGEFIFRVKPAKALVALLDEKKEWYASSLAKEVDCTFPHIVKLLSNFAALGLVSFYPKGRKKLISLTLKGRKLGASISTAFNLLK